MKDHHVNIVSVKFDGDEFHVKETCFQTRGERLMNIIARAFNTIDKESIKPFEIFLYTGDISSKYIEGWEDADCYSFSGEEYSDKLIPDFNFSGWPEVGIYDYATTCKRIVKESEKEPVFDNMFWAGNTGTHINRKKFASLVKDDDRIIVDDIIGWRFIAGTKTLRTLSGSFTSMPEHCQYKYLIDIEGVGYSGRIKHLMHTNRPLFIQDRPWKEWWFFQLEPFVHYIPVENDFSDFYERFEWAMSHEKETKEIAKNAQDFAINNLRLEDAVARFKKIFLEAGGCVMTTSS
jgi:hypothetical protein